MTKKEKEREKKQFKSRKDIKYGDKGALCKCTRTCVRKPNCGQTLHTLGETLEYQSYDCNGKRLQLKRTIFLCYMVYVQEFICILSNMTLMIVTHLFKLDRFAGVSPISIEDLYIPKLAKNLNTVTKASYSSHNVVNH
uniref:Uncharacterized protein n=1 Tax=Glossina brevipalpis TaxID=37001 RepID=A0A1A9WUJ1_9MUSC